MSTLIRGDKLSLSLRREVLSRYVHRCTTENGYHTRNPCGARVAAVSDAQWLAEHAFYVTRRGALDARYRFCQPAFMAGDC